MIDRYANRKVYKNDDEKYEEFFRLRGIKFINQYGTPNGKNISYEQYNRLKIVEHTWKTGDRFYKLSNEYYGDPKDWWIIAQFNSKPTESHLSPGDILLIPLPLHEIVNILR